MKERNVILFTGQSGIKAIDCLKRLSPHINPEPEIISIEKKMTEISGRPFREEILLEKVSYQYKLWKKAFNNVLNKLDDFNSAKKIFLTLHGVYYHQDKREFVSPIDPELITKLKGKVKMLIVFIDDIYDIYSRLMAPKEMYNYVERLKPLEALYSSIFNLISVLEWRQIEITVSRLIARMLNIPMYIVATKHPISMMVKLINMPLGDLQIFYLSHPISSVRKEAMKQLSNFVGELNSFAKTIIDLPKTVLFLPGTIDELRLKKENDIYLPELLPRWSLPYNEEYQISPPLPRELKEIIPINPRKYDISSSSEVQMSVSYLTKLLWDYIGVQITSRDLSLVEESKNGVIAYRPYFPYKLSGGIIRELEYSYDLYENDIKEKSRRCIILSVVEDQVKARIQHFFALIATLIKSLDEETNRSLQSESYRWISKKEWIEIFSSDDLLKEKLNLVRKDVEKILPEDYSFQPNFLSPQETILSAAEMGKIEKERKKGFQYVVDELLKDSLKDYLIRNKDYLKFSSSDEINNEDISKII